MRAQHVALLVLHSASARQGSHRVHGTRELCLRHGQSKNFETPTRVHFSVYLTVVIRGPRLQDRNLDWFPRLRAMSLLMAAQVDSEGDQVELRGLQTQLETTQTLVALLSQQLSELKEQVMRHLTVSLRRAT